MDRDKRVLFMAVVEGLCEEIKPGVITSDLIYRDTGAMAVDVTDAFPKNKEVFEAAAKFREEMFKEFERLGI